MGLASGAVAAVQGDEVLMLAVTNARPSVVRART